MSYRKLGAVISFMVILLFYFSQDFIVPKSDNASLLNFNLCSFYGVAATIIGLIFTIFEVLNAVSISKSIEIKVTETIDGFKNNEVLWTSSSCIELIEKIIDCISAEKFTDAKYLLRDLRKRLHRVQPSLISLELPHDERKNKKINLEELEISLQAYEKTTIKSPISRAQQRSFTKSLLSLRGMIEPNRQVSANKGDENASSKN